MFAVTRIGENRWGVVVVVVLAGLIAALMLNVGVGSPGVSQADEPTNTPTFEPTATPMDTPAFAVDGEQPPTSAPYTPVAIYTAATPVLTPWPTPTP